MIVAAKSTVIRAYKSIKGIVTPPFIGINQAYRSYRAFKALDERQLKDMGIAPGQQHQTSFLDYVKAQDQRRRR